MVNKKLGVLYIISSAFCFTLMSVFVKLSGDLPVIQKSFFRNTVAMIIAFYLIRRSKEKIKIKKKNIKFYIMRSCFGLMGILCNFYSVDNLILADAGILSKIAPFFMVIFSYLFLKEKVSLYQISAIVGAFIGSLFIIKPSFANASFFPAFIGFMGGVAAAAAYTTVRKLSLEGEQPKVIVLFFSTFSTIVLLPALIFDYHPMTTQQWIYLILSGVAASGGQFSVTKAYSYAPSKEISLFDYTQVIFSAIFGFFLFSQVPDILSWVGYFIIILMAVVMFLINNKKNPKESRGNLPNK